MNPQLRVALRALGAGLSPAMIQGTRDLMIPLAVPRDPNLEITRDRKYGPDERNRLDVFRMGKPGRAPVLVYVHGGGFVMGDKTTPGTPYFENVGQWAAQQGWIGVTLTYRLAPAHRWPSGPEDMSLAVAWLREHIADFGGDPQKIFLVGQSAGASHVGAYVAHSGFHAGDIGIAGAVLVSGVFDLSTQPANPYSTAYFGGDMTSIAAAASTMGMAASQIPLLFTVSEFDPPDFHAQAMQLAEEWHRHKGRFPPMQFLVGHNHISPVQSVGSTEDQLARHIADFIAVVTG